MGSKATGSKTMGGKAASVKAVRGKAKRLEAAYRQLRGQARRALAVAGAFALGVTALELGSEAVVAGLSADAATAASVAALGVVAALVIVLIVLEARAWKATVAACRREPSFGQGDPGRSPVVRGWRAAVPGQPGPRRRRPAEPTG